jgi:hypothetical protein
MLPWRPPKVTRLFHLEEIALLERLSRLRQIEGMGLVGHQNQQNSRRFPGGARRTDRKFRFDLIPFEFLESVAEALTAGAIEYGDYNWKRGQKDFFLDAWNHAFVHLEKFKEGDRSEDHLGHLACNVAFLIWAVKNGVVSQEDFRAPK